MRLWFLVLLTFNFAFLISACGLDIEDPTPPTPPVWVQKSLPEEWPERGIDAHESGGIFLEWRYDPTENFDSYLLYRAEWFDSLDSLGNYDLLSRLETEAVPLNKFVDVMAHNRIRYYYKIRAEDDTGNRSEFSDSVTYMLLPAIRLIEMNPNGNTSLLPRDRTLSWIFNYQEMEEYILTIVTEQNELVYRILFQPHSYTGGVEEWQIPIEIGLGISTIYKWRIDTGADYYYHLESTGSESAWATFVYNG
jgi:hypothetical protein